jgi:processive 1,2-diacylglycerol beta-glucosyltransferase
MKKVLLLYISNNSGHHRATKAIEEALHLSSTDVKVVNMNCFNYTNPVFEKVLNSIYNKVIKIKPEVWENLYDNPKVYRKTRKLRRLIHKMNSNKLERLIKKSNPDVIACTQAFPCGMVADYKKKIQKKKNKAKNKDKINKKHKDFDVIGVLTDYAPHSYWMYDNVSAYIVPSKQCKQRFIESGIEKDRIYPFGIPISPKFFKSTNKEATRRSLRLSDDLPTILIMGGGQGLGPIEDLIYAINTIEAPFQVIVVCGTNKKLKKWLEKRKLLFRKKMAILGYTREVEMLMDVSDIVVSKPGGLTTAEALTKNLPIVIVNPIPGQEAKNTEFLLGEGVAVKAKSPLDAAVLIEDLLNDKKKLKQMKENTQKHSQPQSAIKAAELILDLIDKKNKYQNK